MYYSEKINPKMLQKIQSGEDNRHYKTNGSRIVFTRNCIHCDEEFWPRRRNQKYCSDSCRVMACQKRTNKGLNRSITKKTDLKNIMETDPDSNKSKRINWTQVKESAIGSASVEGLKYLLHDIPQNQKLDRILQLLESKAIVFTPIRKYPLSFIGMEQFQGKLVSVFKDPTNNAIIGYHQSGDWLVKQMGLWYRFNSQRGTYGS